MGCHVHLCLLTVLIALTHIDICAAGSRLEYSGLGCQGQTFSFECPRGYIIDVQTGFYGRNNTDRCVDAGYNGTLDTTCNLSDAKSRIISHCANKEDCLLEIGDDVFGDPCPGTPKLMKVDFHCIEPVLYALQCEGNKLSLECPDGYFINPDMSVMHGRLNDVTCSHDSAVIATNCSSETALDTIVDLCSTKRKCDLYVETPLLGDPCPGNYKYLQVNYTCSTCQNEHGDDADCDKWEGWNECDANRPWMMAFCRKSCTDCAWKSVCENSHDNEAECDYWASTGECNNNPNFMHWSCRRSCNVCPDGTSTVGPTTLPTTTVSTTSTIAPSTTTPYIPGDGVSNIIICEGDKEEFECPSGQYIIVYSAKFGRTSNTTCVADRQTGYNTTQCHGSPDVLEKFRTTCNGRSGCSGSAYSDAMGDLCPGIYKYLDIHYGCKECSNKVSDISCELWAESGNCAANRLWMNDNCYKSCSNCSYSSCGNMLGEDDACDYWAMRNECNANKDWMTGNCKESCRKCPKQAPVCDPDCGDHGRCTSDDTCTCDSGYTGVNCTVFSCEGVNDCGTHGTCTGPNLCQCQQGWTGVKCNEFGCQEVNDCSGNGKCVAPDTCGCYQYWSGASCADCFVGFDPGPSCLPCPNCVHGSCNHNTTRHTIYKGCYRDDPNDPDFTHEVGKEDTMTSLSCRQLCQALNYKYAATTGSNTCKCGNRYDSHGVSTSCDLVCTGAQDPHDVCGGIGAYSVWQVYEGYCVCEGDNWAGRLCDQCATGYTGTTCLPTTTQSSTSTTSTTSTTTTPATTTNTSSTVTDKTKTPTTVTTSPATTAIDTTGTTTPGTGSTTTTSTDTSTPTSTTNTSATTSTSTTTTTPQTQTPSSKPTDTPASTTIRTPNANDVMMVLVLNRQWKNIYNDSTNNETESLLQWISYKLRHFYENDVRLKLSQLIISNLRPGSIIVDHILVVYDVSSVTVKRNIQCAITDTLSQNDWVIADDLQARVQDELVMNCAVKGDFCLNGGTLGFDDNGYWICDCPYGFEGPRCGNSKKDTIIIVVIVVVSLAIPLITIAVICCVVPRYCHTKDIRRSRSARSNGAGANTSFSNDGTARSFEFHSMSKGHSMTHVRMSNKKKLFHDSTSSLGVGEDNNAIGYMPHGI